MRSLRDVSVTYDLRWEYLCNLSSAYSNAAVMEVGASVTPGCLAHVRHTSAPPQHTVRARSTSNASVL